MPKTLIVAQSEFATLVRSKAFIVSIVLMPVVMVLSVVLMRATKNATDGKDRTFAVVDYTGALGEPLVAVAQVLNAGSGDLVDPQAPRTTPRFIAVEVKPDGRAPDDLRLELSDRVRREELFAFVELPENLLDPDAKAQIRYYSDHPSYNALPMWLRATVNGIVLNERFRRASIDRALVARLTRQAPVENLGLFERDTVGSVKQAEEVDQVRAQGVPLAMLVLMYITVMSSAPQLLNSVIEEKMSRISEVLMGAITPFQLMMGKLIGSVGVSVLLAAIYIAGGLVVAQYWGGYASAVTPGALAWFTLFLVMAGLIFGSIFIAIGAACNDLKDTQSMATPAMVLVMLPMFTWMSVLRAPDGMTAAVLSLVPTAAPFLMMLRISLRPGPPAWQIALSIALMAGTVVLAIWAAGKIFRTGLLMQGKSATMTEMLRWVRAK
jgi:ABC-2 type transport system permease protein